MRTAALTMLVALAVPRPAVASRANVFRSPDLVVMAEVIVHGRVQAFGAAPGERDVAEAVVAVQGTLKGAAPGRTLRVRYRLPRVGTRAGYPLSSTTLVLRPGHRYVFFLVARRPGESFLRLVEPTDGAAPDTPALRAELRALLRRARPGRWHADPRGVRTLLLGPTEPVAVGGALDLRVLVQVTGQQPMKIRRVRFPESTMSWTELVVERGGRGVPSRPVPWVTKAERDAYFQRHGLRYRYDLPPWDVTVVHLSRVSTAVRGWGYKEDLRFRYYPMTSPGRYLVRARLHRVVSGLPVIETAPIPITLVPAPRAPRGMR